ncbi:MAG: SH3 domain-containing protein [Oligoflexia bacterium]|nr:SH3 domain-containing protein [Oligoflexia bacterium]
MPLPRRHRLRLAAFLCSLTLLCLPDAALAVRKARVRAATPLLRRIEAPQEVLRNLAAGTALQTSDQMKSGYYKVLTPDGTLGYVSAGALAFEAARPPAGPNPVVPPQGAATPKSPAKTGRSHVPSGPRFALRLFGGFVTYSAQELNTQLGLEDFKSALGAGAEIAYSLSPTLAAVIRGEYLSRAILASDPSQTPAVDYEFRLNALPLAAGVEYSLMNDPDFQLRTGLLLGASPATKLSAIATTLPAPNETAISGKALQAIIKADLGWKISSSLGLFAQLGFRYLKTAQLVPAAGATGDQIFRVAGGGSTAPYVPVAIDLSGMIATLGASIHF